MRAPPQDSGDKPARQPRAAGVDPFAYPPRGMSREEAARYVGIGPTFFDEMVADGRMPKPRAAGARVIWDRVELDIFFSDLPSKQGNRIDRALRGRGGGA